MKTIVPFILAFILFSCGASSVKNPEKKPLFEVLEQQMDGGASIRFFEILTEPKEIKMLQNDERLKNKISPEDIQTSNFIILNMGENKSRGYVFGIESVVETDKNIIVIIKENIQESNGVVEQAITNPFWVVKINSKKEIIIK